MNLRFTFTFFLFTLFVITGCDAKETFVNRGDLAGNVPCMDKKGISFEKRADGFYLTDSEWEKFIMFCS